MHQFVRSSSTMISTHSFDICLAFFQSIKNDTAFLWLFFRWWSDLPLNASLCQIFMNHGHYLLVRVSSGLFRGSKIIWQSYRAGFIGAGSERRACCDRAVPTRTIFVVCVSYICLKKHIADEGSRVFFTSQTCHTTVYYGFIVFQYVFLSVYHLYVSYSTSYSYDILQGQLNAQRFKKKKIHVEKLSFVCY